MKTTSSPQQSLIEQGQALVHLLAGKIHRRVGGSADLDDLVAYGELGLAQAAGNFDAEKGCRFSTFAYYRIQGAIYDGLSKMSWTSRSEYQRLRSDQLANEALMADAAQNASTGSHSFAGNAGWMGAVTRKLAVVYFVTRGEQQGSGIRDSTVEDLGMAAASDIVALKEIGQKLQEVVNRLPDVQRRLVTLVYFEGMTLQDAANELHISKSWASRLHSRILLRLADDLRRLGINDDA
ncbi:MAG: sigma-70 family RNA polymerase sigma factor [Pirellulaceae bacterium]